MQQFWECSSWMICTAIHASSSWLGWNCPVWRWFWSDDSEPFFSDSEPAVSNLVFVQNHQQEFIFSVLLLLMVVLIKIVGTAFGAKNADVDSFLAIFPTSKHSLRTIAGINRRCDFKQYICCLDCYKTYPEQRHWSIYSHSKPEDFLCDHVAYPRHPHTSKRTKCGTILLKRFKVKFNLKPVCLLFYVLWKYIHTEAYYHLRLICWYGLIHCNSAISGSFEYPRIHMLWLTHMMDKLEGYLGNKQSPFSVPTL